MDNKRIDHWPLTNEELAELLGVSVGRIKNVKSVNRGELEEGVHFIKEWGVKPGSPPMTKWTQEGAIAIATKIRSNKAGIFLEHKGIRERHRSRIEHCAIDIITHAIKGFTQFKRQYSVFPYKVDLYLPEINMCVECDELNHKTGYDKYSQEYRERIIVSKLNCKMLRFNPNETDFNIGDIVNQIFSYIIK